MSVLFCCAVQRHRSSDICSGAGRASSYTHIGHYRQFCYCFDIYVATSHCLPPIAMATLALEKATYVYVLWCSARFSYNRPP